MSNREEIRTMIREEFGNVIEEECRKILGELQEMLMLSLVSAMKEEYRKLEEEVGTVEANKILPGVRGEQATVDSYDTPKTANSGAGEPEPEPERDPDLVYPGDPEYKESQSSV